MCEPTIETGNVLLDEKTTNKRALEKEDGVHIEPKKPRIKKKKVAVLMSYCGQGYLGMQINHGFKTIEEDLFQAFLKLGIMDEESYKFPQSIHFQRAARTDKGVSATKQVVSLRMSRCNCSLFFISHINDTSCRFT